MYGEELDIQVEYIRKRGLSSRRIEALVVSDPTTASRNIHVTEATLDSTGVPTGAYAINPVNGKKIPIWLRARPLTFPICFFSLCLGLRFGIDLEKADS